MKFYIKTLFFWCMFFNCTKPVIYIFTTAYNRPEFIELQFKTLKKFLKDDYEQIFLNDASDSNMENQINTECKKFNIRCFRVPQELHNCYGPSDLGNLINGKHYSFTAAFRQGDGLQYAFDILGFNHNDIVMTLDSDVFLVRDFSIREYLKDFQVGAVPLHSYYGFPGYGESGYPFLADSPHLSLTIFDISKMKHTKSLIFKPGMLSYSFYDAGFLLQYYFNSHPDVKFKHMKYDSILKLGNLSKNELIKCGYNTHQINFIQNYIKIFDNPKYKFLYTYDKFAFIENVFLDFGSGRALFDFNDEKFNLYKAYLNSIL